MADDEFTSTAKVRIVLEVDSASWGSKVTAEEMFRLTAREAQNAVTRLLVDYGSKNGPRMRIVGDPVVEWVVGRRKP